MLNRILTSRQLFLYSLFKEDLSSSERIVSNNGKTVNNELETIWKIANVFHRKVLYLQQSGGTGTMPVRIIGVPSEIGTGSLRNSGALPCVPSYSVLIFSVIRCWASPGPADSGWNVVRLS